MEQQQTTASQQQQSAQMASTSPQSGGSPGGAGGSTTAPPPTVPAVAPPSTRKKTGKFLGSALNITNRYRANSSSLSKVSLAITNLKVIQNVPLPPPISAMIASDIPPVCKYLPSYRLTSRNPFNREACEAILRESMDKSLQGVEYSSYFAPSLCQQICEDIKTRVKELKFDRYKIIVTVTIGERYMQGLKAITQFLWDPEKDSYATCIYDASPSLVAVGTIYAIYFD
ncbi:dynein light chain Tctex-type 4-like isoform X1 [Anopheles arabiensis]|uniref:dynein light chain Tctex-type 4-like isoform X1 n=1 Tax=Anopheles arabiensis TaxID=7173 RepID=UPI001AAC51B1|nr:dynein light chain Tctex-type 4-like isoform X1 [Anopheles arabiensis]XP_061498548.1 dynein light chain Tctex-type 4 isoform X1 [Anopheles gambiae]